MYIIDIIVGLNVGLKLFEELGIKDILAVKLYYCQYIILKVEEKLKVLIQVITCIMRLYLSKKVLCIGGSSRAGKSTMADG